MKKLISLLLPLLLLACNNETVTHNNNDESSVFYTISVVFNWNAEDFPTDYPSNAHFSPLVAWSHSTDITYLTTGTLASDGIESMAETGSTSLIRSEIETMIANGEGRCLIITEGLDSGVGTITLEIEVNEDNPAVSFTTMVAPSPDWYIGAIHVNLLQDSVFVTDLTVDGLVYDSGTDSGISFTSGDADTSPQDPIALFVDAPLGDGATVDSNICTVIFTKIEK